VPSSDEAVDGWASDRSRSAEDERLHHATGARSSSGPLPASGRCSGPPLRATRTGTSRP